MDTSKLVLYMYQICIGYQHLHNTYRYVSLTDTYHKHQMVQTISDFENPNTRVRSPLSKSHTNHELSVRFQKFIKIVYSALWNYTTPK